jgi:hypothetical protein
MNEDPIRSLAGRRIQMIKRPSPVFTNDEDDPDGQKWLKTRLEKQQRTDQILAGVLGVVIVAGLTIALLWNWM